jgi:general stress protein 26
MSSENDVKRLEEKIKDVRMAMMTTVEADGTLHSRPMATLDMEPDGTLWFFTLASAPKVSELQQHQQINVTYAKPEDNLFVSVSGTAQLVRDRQKVEDMWKPYLKPWFPKGKDDPDLALLRVNIAKAEYWDAPSGKMGILYSAVKGLATGGRDLGENQKLNLE